MTPLPLDPILKDLNKHLSQRIDTAIGDFLLRLEWMDLYKTPSQKAGAISCIIAAGLRIAAQASIASGVPHKLYIQYAHEVFNKYHQENTNVKPGSDEPADFTTHRPYK